MSTEYRQKVSKGTARGVLVWDLYQRRGRRGYEIAKQGKVPVAAAVYRDPGAAATQKHAALEQAAKDARSRPPVVLDQTLVDLKLYRAQWRRILSTTLYFLEVQAAGETLYKIGVTQRSVDERVAAIAQELRAVAGDVTIRRLDAWSQRGNVNLYFKHRYGAEQRQLGSLTEYFAFADLRLVLQDLRRMPAKTRSPLEQAVLDKAPTAIERELAAEVKACDLEQKTLLGNLL